MVQKLLVNLWLGRMQTTTYWSIPTTVLVEANQPNLQPNQGNHAVGLTVETKRAGSPSVIQLNDQKPILRQATMAGYLQCLG